MSILFESVIPPVALHASVIPAIDFSRTSKLDPGSPRERQTEIGKTELSLALDDAPCPVILDASIIPPVALHASVIPAIEFLALRSLIRDPPGSEKQKQKDKEKESEFNYIREPPLYAWPGSLLPLAKNI